MGSENTVTKYTRALQEAGFLEKSPHHECGSTDKKTGKKKTAPGSYYHLGGVGEFLADRILEEMERKTLSE